MADTANNELLDRVVRHQVYLERFKGSELPKLIAQLNALDADLLDQLHRADPSSLGGKRLIAMLDKVSEISDEATKRYAAALNGSLTALGNYETSWMSANIAQSIGAEILVTAGLDIITPDPNLLKAAINSRPLQGRLLRDWVTGLGDARKSRLAAAIRIAMIEQQTIGQLVTRILGTKANNYEDGILAISRRGAEALARTATQHVSNEARRLSYDANGAVIDQVQWVATLDGRTTPYCRAMDGKLLPMDSGPRPPAHINCRSTTVPVLKSWADIGIEAGDISEGTRASMNGQVADTLTYDAWLRKQSPEFQNEVLGREKANLFRNGLTMDKFVDLKTQHEFTLDELRQREPDVWSAAHAGKTASAGRATAGEEPSPYDLITPEQANRSTGILAPDKNGLLVGAREVKGSGASLPLELGAHGSFKAGEDAVRRYMTAAADDLHDPGLPGAYEHMTALEADTGNVLWRTSDNERSQVGIPNDLFAQYRTEGAMPARSVDIWHNHPSAMSPLSTQDMVFTMNLPGVRQIVAQDALGNVFRGEAPHFNTAEARDAHMNWLHFGHRQWMAEFKSAIPEFDELTPFFRTMQAGVVPGKLSIEQGYHGYGNHLSWRLMDELGLMTYHHEATGVLAEMDAVLNGVLAEEGMTLLDFAREAFNPKTIAAQLDFAAKTKRLYR